MLKVVNEQAKPEECLVCSIRDKALFCDVLDNNLSKIFYSLKLSRSYIPPKTIIYHEGDTFEKCFTLKSGWMILYKTLKNGKRQILNFFVPGDFLGYELDKNGLQSYTLETLSECVLCVFPADKLHDTMINDIDLVHGYNKVLSKRNSLYAQHLVNVGRRDSKERLAAIVLELFGRTKYSIDSKGRKYMHFPPTQEELADTLGLTQVHVNRVIRGMIDAKIMNCEKKILTILDEAKLKKMANI